MFYGFMIIYNSIFYWLISAELGYAGPQKQVYFSL
jgi:hypothetical protein